MHVSEFEARRFLGPVMCLGTTLFGVVLDCIATAPDIKVMLFSAADIIALVCPTLFGLQVIKELCGSQNRSLRLFFCRTAALMIMLCAHAIDRNVLVCIGLACAICLVAAECTEGISAGLTISNLYTAFWPDDDWCCGFCKWLSRLLNWLRGKRNSMFGGARDDESSDDDSDCGDGSSEVASAPKRTTIIRTLDLRHLGHAHREQSIPYIDDDSPSQDSSELSCRLRKACETLLTRSEYDSGVNTFSPEGLLFQVEYAIETVKLGATSIGIRTSAVVVLAAEKRATSSLLVNDSKNKIFKVDNHISTTFTGLIADSRTLEAQSFWLTYNSKIRVEDVTQSVANIALHFGDDDSKNETSLGCRFSVRGVDKINPRLIHDDLSGIFIDCAAKSIGAASDGADQQFKEKYQETMTIAKAEMLALNILKQFMEEKLGLFPCKSDKGAPHRLTPSELEPLIAGL